MRRRARIRAPHVLTGTPTKKPFFFCILRNSRLFHCQRVTALRALIHDARSVLTDVPPTPAVGRDRCVPAMCQVIEFCFAPEDIDWNARARSTVPFVMRHMRNLSALFPEHWSHSWLAPHVPHAPRSAPRQARFVPAGELQAAGTHSVPCACPVHVSASRRVAQTISLARLTTE